MIICKDTYERVIVRNGLLELSFKKMSKVVYPKPISMYHCHWNYLNNAFDYFILIKFMSNLLKYYNFICLKYFFVNTWHIFKINLVYRSKSCKD